MWPGLFAQTMTPLLITPTELASSVGLKTRTIYNRIHTEGDLPPVFRLGRLPRFALTDVRAWVEAKRSAAMPAPSPTRRRPGRPTKAEQIAHRHLHHPQQTTGGQS